MAVDDDLTVDRAQASILDDIAESEVAEVVLVVVLASRRRPRAGAGWRLYRALDRRRSSLADDPDQRAPIGSVAGGSGRIVRGDGANEALTSETPDVLLDLTRTGVAPRYVDVARHGTWRFTTSVSLQAWLIRVGLIRRATANRPAALLGEGIFAHDPVAVARSRATAIYGTTHLVIQNLDRLYRENGVEDRPEFDRTSGPGPWPSGRHEPTTWQVARWIGPVLIGRFVGRLRRRLLRADEVPLWRIAIRPRSARPSIEADPYMADFRWVESPRGHLYADPFLIERDGRTWLLFEDYAFDDRRGAIAVAAVTPDGGLEPPIRILDAPGHLSYPYVFEADGDVYMVPESSSAGVVSLYRATAFPEEWTKVGDLFHGRALDTSILRSDDQWWFFTTIREPRGGASMLLLFASDELTGPWRRHPESPISLDVRDVRGAGRIFHDGGRIIRPSQDGSRTYGYGFGLNEIVELSATRYRERRITTVLPRWQRGLTATHTYALSERFEAIDGRVERARGDVI